MIKRAAAVALFVACIMVFLPFSWAPAAAVVVALVAAAVRDRSFVKTAFKLGWVLALLFSAALAGAFVMWSAGLARGVSTGLTVLARLLVLWLALGLLSTTIDTDVVLRAFRRLGFDRVGLVLGLALNALPRLLGAGRTVWIAHRVRFGSRFNAIRRSGVVAEVLLAHTIRIADDAAAAAALRGHEALIKPRAASLRISSPVVVLTGRSGAGKTTVMESIIERLREESAPVAGLIQPARYLDGEKIGFEIRDLQTGKETLFAERVRREDGVFGMGYRFEEEGRLLAQEALSSIPRDSVLVVDEMGPLELRGKGHMGALQKAIAERPPILLLLVVRRHLIPAFLSALSATDATVIDVETASADVEHRILQLLRQPLTESCAPPGFY